jgi:hypothetical protein
MFSMVPGGPDKGERMFAVKRTVDSHDRGSGRMQGCIV